MARENLIEHCIYYNGEKECPKAVNSMFWEYERVWVDMTLEAIADPNGSSAQYASEMLSDYMRSGLSHFEADDGVPVTLKALLFNRYCHWNSAPMLECANPFKEWYIKEYR